MSRIQPEPWQPITDRLDLAVLGKMGEELSECASAANRCVIQGIDEREPETGKLNREWLTEEIADVLATVNTAIAHFGLDPGTIYARVDRKMEHFASWHALIQREDGRRPLAAVEGAHCAGQLAREVERNSDERPVPDLEAAKAQFAHAVPADLAEQARPIAFGFEGRRLIVECDSSIVAQQLAFLAARICAACKVENLRFRVKGRGPQ